MYEPLMAAFEETYNGNRAPLPIFLHTTWQVWGMVCMCLGWHGGAALPLPGDGFHVQRCRSSTTWGRVCSRLKSCAVDPTLLAAMQGGEKP